MAACMCLIPASSPSTVRLLPPLPIDLTFYDYSTGTPVAVYQGDTEEAITDGYFSESTLRSAPYFSLRIDGITEDADPVA